MKRSSTMNKELAVSERYSNASIKKENQLCCPVSYDPKYLEVIPQEILERDYGCGDPTKYIKDSEIVLDLGSGCGKNCYIASQIVGPKGKVIGIDFNPDMLSLARKHKKKIAKQIGFDNVEFHRAKIQDLKTNLVIKDNLVDVVISNCVFNLVSYEARKELFSETKRVLKHGGRVVISDIVSDEEVPESLKNDPRLWSGCISGAFQEKELLKGFEDAGFYGIEIVKRDEKPWKTIKGIEFRSITVVAYKGKEGECLERNQAVIYKGPWSQVKDDDNHIYKRGVRTAVCDKTFKILTKEPYRSEIIPIEPITSILPKDAKQFNCSRDTERHPKETKGLKYKKTTSNNSKCNTISCC